MYKLEASALNMNLCQFRYSLLSWVLQTTKAIVFLPIKAWNETIPHLLLPGVGYLPGVLHPLHRTGCFTFPLHNGVTSTQAKKTTRHIHPGIYVPPAPGQWRLSHQLAGLPKIAPIKTVLLLTPYLK